MREWLKCFFYEKEATLVINGKSYKPSDWEKIGEGSEKRVFKIKDEKLCFFIPNKWRSEDDWNSKIEAEKYFLDEMTKLGMKTQQFELVSIDISAPNKPTYTIKALTTTDFENLCKEESIVIHNPKGDQRIIGTPPDFMAMRDKFKDKQFVREVFKKFIDEYATAYTFSLPVSALQSNDDSQHLCFELSANPEQPPVVRYMFWDVVSDMGNRALIPIVPTLKELRKGAESYTWRTNDNDALAALASSVAYSIYEMLNQSVKQNIDPFKFIKELETDILSAIDDDAFLLPALEHAKKQAVKMINENLTELSQDQRSNEIFIGLMLLAIPTDDIDLVKRCFQFCSPSDIKKEQVDKVMEIASKYNNPVIIQCIKDNLGTEKEKVQGLKPSFFKQHQVQINEIRSTVSNTM
ncbi:hypothetical protein [Legionella waltersii]|uniref:Uncharacterized protein n=1 Tax=Legionella waltersii TaxID=66969 RepID=A0A0W1ABY8_9GAMM|nr:hypothetical protein [Legionella waltersii]KTD78792.1 hypothetical protein Lwal_1562 [Legionella waltersii]SNV11121.1 Uncharacterised protein [Legionella waltersii]